jgi:hypothetical protein
MELPALARRSALPVVGPTAGLDELLQRRSGERYVLVPSRAGFTFSMPLALLFPVMTNW